VERPAQSRDLMLVLPALPGSLRAARAAIRAGLDPLGWPTERAEDIELAVNEAVANVVDHAYPPGAPGPANLHAWLSTDPRTRDRRIVVTVTDRGRWARHHPDTHPLPTRGHGLVVMRGCMDELHVQRGAAGTTVIMVMHLVDGERKPIEPPHPDRESAEFAAKTHRDASDRWTGAAEQVSPQDRPENKATDGE